VHYVLHKKYYAEVLCKNKDKPMMHCNGKCHLKKEIKESENTGNNPNKPVPVPKTENEKFPVLLNLFNAGDSSLNFITNTKNIEYIFPHFKDLFFDVITPPPKFSIHL